jgi:hypothetical protein
MDTDVIINSARLSIWLDTYDDIFSDFDPRGYEERALSDDFVNEARKMVKEKPDGEVELKLLLPMAARDINSEKIIIKRMHRHFSQFAEHSTKEMNDIRRKGYLMCIIGFIVMIVAANLVTISNKTFYINALQIILEPAGWFFVWTGFDHLFENARKRKPEIIFNQKMAKSEIIFISI